MTPQNSLRSLRKEKKNNDLCEVEPNKKAGKAGSGRKDTGLGAFLLLCLFPDGTRRRSVEHSTSSRALPLPQNFETPAASFVASFQVIFIGIVQLVLHGFVVWDQGLTEVIYSSVAVFNWHGILWLLVFVLFPRLKRTRTVEKRVIKGIILACVAILMVIPRTKYYRGVPASAAAAGSAGIFNGLRAIEVLVSTDNFIGWGPWQHMFHLCCFGWHDIITSRPITKQKLDGVAERKDKRKLDHHAVRTPLVRQLASALIIGAIASLCLFLVPGHAEAVQLLYKHVVGVGDAASVGDQSLARTCLLCFFRWQCGLMLALSFFLLMDSMTRLIYCEVCSVTVDSLFGPHRHTTTVARFWGSFWNQPVNRVLRRIFVPARVWMGTFLAKVLVFFLSGMFHTYALNCTNRPLWMQVTVMAFFMIQLPVMFLEDVLSLKGRLWVYFAITITSPLFIEPILETSGV